MLKLRKETNVFRNDEKYAGNLSVTHTLACSVINGSCTQNDKLYQVPKAKFQEY